MIDKSPGILFRDFAIKDSDEFKEHLDPDVVHPQYWLIFCIYNGTADNKLYTGSAPVTARYKKLEMVQHWHTLSEEEALKEAGSHKAGLDDALAKQRLEEYGRNELQANKIHPVFIFFRQFLDVMILVLMAAAAVSLFIGDISDTIVILGIIILNAIIGFIEGYRASHGRLYRRWRCRLPPYCVMKR